MSSRSGRGPSVYPTGSASLFHVPSVPSVPSSPNRERTECGGDSQETPGTCGTPGTREFGPKFPECLERLAGTGSVQTHLSPTPFCPVTRTG